MIIIELFILIMITKIRVNYTRSPQALHQILFWSLRFKILHIGPQRCKVKSFSSFPL